MFEHKKDLELLDKPNELTKQQANELIKMVQLMEEYTLQEKKEIIKLIKRDTKVVR
jgi:hypothetical protein